MHVSERKDPVVLNDNVRGKGFIWDNFLFEGPSQTLPLPLKKQTLAEAAI